MPTVRAMTLEESTGWGKAGNLLLLRHTWYVCIIMKVFIPFTTGDPFLGTKLLGFSIGRGSGALEGLRLKPLTG